MKELIVLLALISLVLSCNVDCTTNPLHGTCDSGTCLCNLGYLKEGCFSAVWDLGVPSVKLTATATSLWIKLAYNPGWDISRLASNSITYKFAILPNSTSTNDFANVATQNISCRWNSWPTTGGSVSTGFLSDQEFTHAQLQSCWGVTTEGGFIKYSGYLVQFFYSEGMTNPFWIVGWPLSLVYNATVAVDITDTTTWYGIVIDSCNSNCAVTGQFQVNLTRCGDINCFTAPPATQRINSETYFVVKSPNRNIEQVISVKVQLDSGSYWPLNVLEIVPSYATPSKIRTVRVEGVPTPCARCRFYFTVKVGAQVMTLSVMPTEDAKELEINYGPMSFTADGPEVCESPICWLQSNLAVVVLSGSLFVVFVVFIVFGIFIVKRLNAVAPVHPTEVGMTAVTTGSPQ